jgi:hypothetical protein
VEQTEHTDLDYQVSFHLLVLKYKRLVGSRIEPGKHEARDRAKAKQQADIDSILDQWLEVQQDGDTSEV